MRRIQIEPLAQIAGPLDPQLTECQYEQHLAFSSLPTNVLLMAQELLKVETQLKSGAQIVGHEVARIDDQVQILDLGSQNVQEMFAARVAERLGETDDRQAKHKAVTSQLYEMVQGTEVQSLHRDLMLDKEIVRLNQQYKWEIKHHQISSNLLRQELRHHKKAQQA